MRKYLLIVCCLGFLTACESSEAPAGNPADSETTPPSSQGPDGTAPGTADDKAKVQDSREVMDQIPAGEVLAMRVIRFYNYQPTTELAENLEDPAEYEQWKTVLMTAIRRRVAALPRGEALTGRMVVAASADRQLRSWFVFPDGQPKGDLREAIAKAIRDVPPPAMKQGYVVFGVQLDFWDADSREEPDPGVPMPQAWTEAGKQFDGPQPVATLLRAAWN